MQFKATGRAKFGILEYSLSFLWKVFSQTNKKTFAFLFIVTNHAVHEKNEVTAKLLIVGYLNQLQVGFDNYVTNHRKILNYAWVNFPLAYTQVVHMTVYAYFFATLFR